MLTELVEFGHKLDEKMKAMLRETKENVQGTNRDGNETGTEVNGMDQREERNIQAEKNEEKRLESIMLSEISQAVRDKYHMISPLTGT